MLISQLLAIWKTNTGKALFDNLDLAIDHHKHKPNKIAQMMWHKIKTEEIEDRFGSDENDLPTQKIAANIKKHLEELI